MAIDGGTRKNGENTIVEYNDHEPMDSTLHVHTWMRCMIRPRLDKKPNQDVCVDTHPLSPP